MKDLIGWWSQICLCFPFGIFLDLFEIPPCFWEKEWGGGGCVWSVITVVTKQTHLIFYSDHIVGIAAPLIAFQWHCIKIATRSFISLLPGPSAYCSMPILLNIWMERSDKICIIWQNIFIAIFFSNFCPNLLANIHNNCKKKWHYWNFRPKVLHNKSTSIATIFTLVNTVISILWVLLC